jgi:hypothetical protein
VPEKFKYLYGCQGSQKTKYLLISDLSDGDHIEMVDYYDRNSFGPLFGGVTWVKGYQVRRKQKTKENHLKNDIIKRLIINSSQSLW